MRDGLLPGYIYRVPQADIPQEEKVGLDLVILPLTTILQLSPWWRNSIGIIQDSGFSWRFFCIWPCRRIFQLFITVWEITPNVVAKTTAGSQDSTGVLGHSPDSGAQPGLRSPAVRRWLEQWGLEEPEVWSGVLFSSCHLRPLCVVSWFGLPHSMAALG